MFVDLSYRYVDESTNLALATLMGSASTSAESTAEEDTVLKRLITLANSFVGGVLGVVELDAERAAVREVCVDEKTCIDEVKLLQLLSELGEESDATSQIAEEAEIDAATTTTIGVGNSNGATTSDYAADNSEGEEKENSSTTTLSTDS